MAFRAPKPHAPQRVYTSTQPPRDELFAEASPASAAGAARLEDSQEWILFSPAQPSNGNTVPDTVLSHTTSTDKTRDTVGRSRLSDYGSLGTEVRSWEAGTEDVHESTIHEDDDEELDSLDSHLLEFRSHESYHNGREEETPHGLLSQHLVVQEQEAASHSVFPNHDGLGSFQSLGRRAASNLANPGQEYTQFPFPSHQHNQRRTKRRRESLDLILAREQTAREQEEEKEREKRTRIEEWRLEQSRAIMEEVQKESRRQRQRLAGKRTNTLRDYHEGEMASMGGVLGTAWDDMAAGQPVASNHVDFGESREGKEGEEGFWARVTRRLVQDLMGIDDKLLGILFGESLPDDLETQLSNAEGMNGLDGHAADSGWENRLLERIARELGLLVNQISDHPGAFNTYPRVQQEPLPYAGLPIIPEATADPVAEQPILSPAETEAVRQSNIFFPTISAAQSKAEPVVYDPISSSRHYFDSEMDYFPQAPAAAPLPSTNLSAGHASSAYQLPNLSIHTLASSPLSPLVDSPPTSRATATTQGFTKEEWEKQLDIGLVFKYLRSRFSSRKTNTHAPFVRHHNSTPAEAAARAARVRQHHPLVSNRPVAERRGSYKVVVKEGVVGQGVGLQRRRSSSCASQSTKVSASQRSRRLSGSSRHYWDIGCGGSLGSGSIIVSTGGMGGWGDV